MHPNCRKSRKRFKKRKLFESYDADGLAGGYGSAGGYASASDYGDGGYSSAGGERAPLALIGRSAAGWP